MKKKVLITVVIVFVVIALLSFMFLKPKTIVKKDIKKNTNEEKWYEPIGDKSKIDVYLIDDEPTILDENEDHSYIDDTYVLKNTYLCNSENCIHYGYYKNASYVIIKDGDKYLIYDYENNRALELNLSNALYKTIELCGYKNKVYGLSISDINDKFAYYSLSSKMFESSFIYDYISNDNGVLFANDMFIASSYYDDKTENYVVSAKTKDVLYTSQDEIYAFGTKKNVYYAKNFTEENIVMSEIYNDSFKLLLDGKRYQSFTSNNDGNLIVINDDNTFSMYNSNGTFIKSSKTYKRIVKLCDDYVIVIDNDDYLKLIDYDGNLKAKFIKIEENHIIYDNLSGYDTKDNKSGVFIVVSDTNVSYEENGRTLYYYYIPKTKETGLIKKTGILGY